MTRTQPSALTLIVSSAPLAERAADIAGAFTTGGWSVRVVTTPSASSWVDAESIRATTGAEPTSVQRLPDRPAPTEFATSSVLVAPLTFNSLNKWTLGIADNYALGILCEALARGLPVVAIPVIGRRFWDHPATSNSMELLISRGVSLVDIASGDNNIRPLESGSGPSLAAAFDPTTLLQRFA